MAIDIQSLPGREWKRCPKYPNYFVSACGKVANERMGRIVKPKQGRDGYHRINVSLGVGGGVISVFVHHMVLITHVGPRPMKAQCRHLDGDKTNNAASNLAWGTAKENAADRKAHGTEAKGVAQGLARLTPGNVRYIRSSDKTTQELAVELCVGWSTVHHVRKGNTWRHIV